MADETRLKIIEMLSCGEMCACDILEHFQITQPTLSYHMKILTDSQIVISKREKSWVRYSNNEELIQKVKLFLNQITEPKENCPCHAYKSNERCN